MSDRDLGGKGIGGEQAKNEGGVFEIKIRKKLPIASTACRAEERQKSLGAGLWRAEKGRSRIAAKKGNASARLRRQEKNPGEKWRTGRIVS